MICLGQAAVSFVLSRGGSWMYAGKPLAAAGIVGVAGLALFGLAHSTVAYAGAAFLLGLCSGFIFVYVAFHAMVHPERSGSYIGINEAIVGLSGILGPLAGGAIAVGTGHSIAFLAAGGSLRRRTRRADGRPRAGDGGDSTLLRLGLSPPR